MGDVYRAEAVEAGRTVQRLLHDRAGLSNAEAKGIVAGGGVTRNGRRVERPDERVEEGDRIEVVREPGRRYHAPRRDVTRGDGYRVVHEDDDVIVLDKEAGVLTVPNRSEPGTSLVDRLREKFRKRGLRGPDVRAVHRIDRFTSGLVVLARTGRAFASLRREFASGRPERIYIALAEGSVDGDNGRLVHRLYEHPKSLKVRVAVEGEPGRVASCRYRVTGRFPHATLLEVALETGRRNQIRVQFAAQGHPLVGDVAYGHPSPWIDRVALHAHRLAFDLPWSGRRLELVSEPPQDFRALVGTLRRGGKPRAATAPGENEETEPRQKDEAPVTRPARRSRGPGRRYR